MNHNELTNNLDRATASKLNPFIGYSSAKETHEQVRFGLAFISTAVSALSDGTSSTEMCGFSIVLDTMQRAMAYEEN